MKRFALFAIAMLVFLLITVGVPRISQSQTSQYYSLHQVAQRLWGQNVRRTPDPQNIPIPFISKSFSDRELARILIALENLNNPNIGVSSAKLRGCVQKYANRDLDSPKTWSRAGGISGLWGNLMIAGDRGVNQRHRLYIDRMNQQSNVLGQAAVGINWRFFDNPYQDFKIELNAHNLLRDYADKTTGWGNTDFWAGVILHEILHNMGYTHRDVVNGNFDPVKGNLVYEVGWCVRRMGDDKKPGSFMLTGDSQADVFVD